MAARLLVIDDQPGLTRVIRQIAQDLDFTTRVCNAAQDVIETALSFQPDVIILDMIMPERDGIDVLHELLLTGLRPRIILSSGLSDGMLRLGAAVARFHGVARVDMLRKPFRRDELTRLLVSHAHHCNPEQTTDVPLGSYAHEWIETPRS